jgi:hypothetical protein
MGRSAHELEKRGLTEIVAALRAKGDHVRVVQLFTIFDALREAAQACDIAAVDRLAVQLDAIITNIGETECANAKSNGSTNAAIQHRTTIRQSVE